MDKELYDKILVLMVIDSAYEKDFGGRYVSQTVFDELLGSANVDSPNMEYIEDRLKYIMSKMTRETS